MGFFKKGKKDEIIPFKRSLQEAPLGYWEEKSYMMVIPEASDSLWWIPKTIVDRISANPEITVLEDRIEKETLVLYVKLKYDNEEYEVGFFNGAFSLPEMYISPLFHFSDEELQKIKNAESALTIFMKFNKNSKKSFHLQLKIATSVIPNLIGLVDESAERLLPARWVAMTAKSSVTPSPSDIFNVQAIYDEKKGEEVWLHTHGLCRCGLTELEILQSSKNNYKNHYNLINVFASFMIDKNGEFDPREESAYLGVLSNGTPIVVTCKSWVQAIKEYDNLKIGGMEDREQSHNSRTSPIFIYKTQKDKDEDKLSKVAEYDNLWGDNPMFFFSDEETLRMKTLAMERFDYVKKAIKDKNNTIIVKIGLPCDNDNDGKEHIWFEILEFDGDKFKARLTQEPYNVSNIHEGDEKWFTVDDVTDWNIYTPKFMINPSNVYLV